MLIRVKEAGKKVFAAFGLEIRTSLRRICERYKAQYVLAAASEAVGTATLNVHADRYGSSFLKELRSKGPWWMACRARCR